MPRFIKKVNHGFKLSDTEGHIYSKKPMTYKKALAQERAINIRKHGGFDPVDLLASGISSIAKSIGNLKPSAATTNLLNKYSKKGGSHQYTYYPENQAINEISASRKSDMLKKFGAILDRPAVILPYGFNARK